MRKIILLILLSFTLVLTCVAAAPVQASSVVTCSQSAQVGVPQSCGGWIVTVQSAAVQNGSLVVNVTVENGSATSSAYLLWPGSFTVDESSGYNSGTHFYLPFAPTQTRALVCGFPWSGGSTATLRFHTSQNGAPASIVWPLLL